MRKFKIAAAVVLALIGVVFVAQNSAIVTVRFLVWEVAASQIILLSGLLLLGFLLGFLVAKLARRRS